MLVRTTKEKKHDHIAYLKNGSGVLSVAKGHTHSAAYVQGQPATIDTMTGAVLAPATPTGWRVGPAPDGHMHEVTEAMVGSDPEITDAKEDNEIVSSVQRLFKRALQYEQKSRKMAEESEGIYNGQGHWKKEQKNDLESKNRAALTINEVESKVDVLCGYKRQNKTDTKFFPIEDGDQRIAQILDIVVKNVAERNNLQLEKALVFEDKCVVGRGLYHIYPDYDENPLGEIKVERFGWRDGYFGPHEKMDGSDAEYQIKAKWYSFEKLEEMYPEKIKEIKENVQILQRDSVEETPSPPQPHTRLYENQYFAGNDPRVSLRDPDFVDFERQQFRLMECWQKLFKQVTVFVKSDDDFVVSSEDWTEGDVKAVKSIPGFKSIKRIVTRIRVTKVAGRVLLDDTYLDPEITVPMFPIVPDYAKKRGELWWGKVEAVKDVQREINKRHSQIVDILNKVAAYGWGIMPGAFPSPAERDKFIRTSSSPGFVVEFEDFNKVKQFEGVKFPAEVTQLEILATQKLDKIMGIPPEMSGFSSSSNMSGVALLEQKRQGLVGNEFLFDGSDYSEQNVSRMIVMMIQKMYSPERILRLIENQATRDKTLTIGEQPAGQAVQQQRDELIQLLKRELFDNPDLLKYDVKVGESAWTPTTRRANLLVWAEMAKTGVPVPPQMLVELSDLPDKDRAIQQIDAMQQAAAQKENQKNSTEIEKTRIAHGAGGGMDGGGMMGG